RTTLSVISTLFPYTTLFRSNHFFTPSVISSTWWRITAYTTNNKIQQLLFTIGKPCICINPPHYGRQVILFSNNLFKIVINSRRRSEEHTSELQSRENLVCRL